MVDTDAREPAAGAGPLTVMVVTPSPELRSRLVSALSIDPEVRVTAEAATVHGALPALRLMAYDILLLDVDPPGEGSDELRRAVQASPKSVVVALTSAADPFFRERCAALGADFVVAKPLELGRIADVMLALRVSDTS
jgi:DNA-binding NarL/FixJ family response regulator